MKRKVPIKMWILVVCELAMLILLAWMIANAPPVLPEGLR